MILPGNVINEYVRHGLISILPTYDEHQLRPSGLRVHLDSKILIPESGQTIDLSKDGINNINYQSINICSKPLILYPGAFVLGSTIESIRAPRNLACKLDGRSTLARIGVIIHCTSNFIDNIYSEHRKIVVELVNNGPFIIRIPYGYGIGMISFERIAGESSLKHEHDQYASQVETTPANLNYKDEPYSGA